MNHLRSITATLLAATALLAVADTAAAAPRTFFAVQGWNHPNAEEFGMMGRGRVGVYRINFSWFSVEPTPGARNWGPFDDVVRNAAINGIAVLPVFVGTPSWAARHQKNPPPPHRRAAYNRFVYDTVARYGRGGSFWRENPGVPYRPIMNYQIYNEPNLRSQWANRPNARDYVNLLAGAARAVKARDRGAKVILAGLPEKAIGIPMTTYLTSIYRVRRAYLYFDVVALHPYAADHRGVLGSVIRARRIMNRYRDGSPIWVTEVGWATGGPVSRGTAAFRTSENGQASRLHATFRTLGAYRGRYRIGMVAWFSWRDYSPSPSEGNFWGYHTGLIRRNGSGKPSWAVFKRFTGGF